MRMMRIAIGFTLACCLGFAPAAAQRRFEIALAPGANQAPVTGRLVVIVAKRDQPEPRLTVSPTGPALFAIDIEQLRPGQTAVVDDQSLGYPTALSRLPDGEYFVQAVVNVYEQARRADGHTIWVKLNDGSQETFNVAAGNIYSAPQRIQLSSSGTTRIVIDKTIPRPADPVDTEWVKRVRVQSQKLTRFWGRPIFIQATVLLPRGYAQRTDVRYPVVFTFGHNIPFGFSTDSARTRNIGQINPVTGVETGWDFYKAWNGDAFPRFIAVSFEQQTPYFPDSYSINSANNGPYADALLEEVIPALERQFRMIGKPYARLAEGASTGGWQTLALQLHYPDYFGGAWVLQPDPIDFRDFQLVNIYEDENAFTLPLGSFLTTERPFRRTVKGLPVWSLRDFSRYEEVMGSRGRGGWQLQGWEAVFGPIGADGYPKPLWDKLTGKIDREVANYWRDNGYDLRAFAEKNWSTIGPRLAGKLHFFAGDMDDFYLNLAVYRFEEFARSTTNPKSDATFTYGRPMKGHSWHAMPWAQLVRQMGEHVRKNTPAGERTTWLY